MRWKGGRRSDYVEDRRGQSSGGGLRLTGRSGGIGTIVLVLVAMYFGVDPSLLVNMLSGEQPAVTSGPQQPRSQAEQELAEFVSVVLADTEDTWTAIFQSANRRYEEPKLVLFSGAVQSACGFAQAAMGPFYCPADRKVYIDLMFYQELRDRFGAPGDFAQAYVIAHEIGHHVQTLLGISERTQAARARLNEVQANQLSVRQELQADCFAGVWAQHADRARQIVEAGDIEEALTAAAAIGDDRLQKQNQGHVAPDSFTHGSSQQRVHWFRQGLQTGDVGSCDTFTAASLS